MSGETAAAGAGGLEAEGEIWYQGTVCIVHTFLPCLARGGTSSYAWGILRLSKVATGQCGYGVAGAECPLPLQTSFRSSRPRVCS